MRSINIYLNKNSIFLTVYSIYIFLSITVENSTYANLLSNFFDVNTFLNISKFLILSILFILILTIRKFKVREILLYIILFFTMLLISYKTKYSTFFFTSVLIVTSSYFDFNKIVNVDLKIKITALIFVLGSYFLGIIDQITVLRGTGQIRYSLGFNYPNRLALVLFCILLDYIFVKYSNWRMRDSIFIIVLLIPMIVQSDSRTSFLSGIVAIVLMIIFKMFPGLSKNRVFSFILSTLFFLFLFMSYYLTINYDVNNKVIGILDAVTSLRISYGNAFYNLFGIHIFGQKLDNVNLGLNVYNGFSTLILDNSYMSLLIRGGILLTTILGTYYSLLLKRIAFIRDNRVILMLVSLLIFGLFENILNSEIFVTPLLASNYFRIKKNNGGN